MLSMIKTIEYARKHSPKIGKTGKVVQVRKESSAYKRVNKYLLSE